MNQINIKHLFLVFCILTFVNKLSAQTTQPTTKPVMPQTTQPSQNAEAVPQLPYHSICLLYTSPSPRDRQKSRMPSSA